MTVASQVKQTVSSLKGIQGTLRIYSNQTRNQETKLVFDEALSVTEDVINDIEKRLQTIELEEPQYKGN